MDGACGHTVTCEEHVPGICGETINCEQNAVGTWWYAANREW